MHIIKPFCEQSNYIQFVKHLHLIYNLANEELDTLIITQNNIVEMIFPYRNNSLNHLSIMRYPFLINVNLLL